MFTPDDGSLALDFFSIPDPVPGSRGKKNHQIPDPQPQHCSTEVKYSRNSESLNSGTAGKMFCPHLEVDDHTKDEDCCHQVHQIGQILSRKKNSRTSFNGKFS
jgi:hypothetical protein